jgi:hypothetical protein
VLADGREHVEVVLDDDDRAILADRGEGIGEHGPLGGGQARGGLVGEENLGSLTSALASSVSRCASRVIPSASRAPRSLMPRLSRAAQARSLAAADWGLHSDPTTH